MNIINRRRNRIATLALCLAVLAACIGYLSRWGQVDRVTDAGVSLVGLVAATGAAVNAISLQREK